jgi:Mrp family chromosome partitioning ATPase
VVVDGSGDEVDAPGGDGGVGRVDRFLLLGKAGNVAAVSVDGAGGHEVTVVDAVGAVVVVDAEGRVASTAGTATIGDDTGPGTLEGFTADDVDAALAVRTRPNSTLLDITYRDGDAVRARVGANAAVAAYQAFVSRARPSATQDSVRAIDELVADVSEELRTVEIGIAQSATTTPTPAGNAAAADLANQRDQLRQRLQTLLTDRDQALTAPSTEPPTFAFVSEATRVTTDHGLGPVRLGIVGAFLGLTFGAIVVFALERRRPRVSSAQEVEAILGVPLLAEVPDHRHEHLTGPLPVSEAPTTHAAEAYRFAAAALGIAREERSYRRVGIVSAGVGEGKTTVAANVALALSQGDQTVVAVDADLEGQVLSFLYLRAAARSDHWQGIADVLTGECTLADALCAIELPPHHVDLLSGGSGAGRARSLVGTDAARSLFDDVARRFDIAIVDLPPLLSLAYVARVIRDLDAVVVVLSHRSSRRDLEELADRLRFIGVPVAGYVLCRAPLRAERTASVSALHHDLGGRPTDRKRLARLARGARVGG